MRDGSWKSSDTNGNFKIIKEGGRLRFNYDTGIAQGNVITWNQGIALDDNGRTGFGTISPSAHIDSNSSSVAQLRLSHTLLDKFTNFTVDTNHDLTIDPSSTGEIKLNATVTVIDEIQHEGDADTKMGFTDDDIEITVGGLSMLKMTEAGQDLITLGPGSGDVDIDFNGDMFLQGSNGFFGVNVAPTLGRVHINDNSFTQQTLYLSKNIASTSFTATFSTMYLANEDSTDNNYARFNFGDGDNSASSSIGGQITSHANNFGELVFWTRGAGGFAERVRIDDVGDVSVGIVAAAARLHVDQSSTTAAKPVLYLDQADLSEEMFQFETTIGVGNAIEAVGGKTLTTTHFIKVTLPGGLTRYLEVGTIA